MLNSTQTKELFDREAVLIGNGDVIPALRATELFGEEAVRFAIKSKVSGRQHANVYFIGDGDESIVYLTYFGLQAAVTYSNIKELSKKNQQRKQGVCHE